MEALAPWHVIVIGVVALVLLYSNHRLPDMARSIGRTLRVVKNEARDFSDDKRELEAAVKTAANETQSLLRDTCGRQE